MPRLVTLGSGALTALFVAVGVASAQAADPRSLLSLVTARQLRGVPAKKTCLTCHHVVPSTSKLGDQCPFCGVVWKKSTSPVLTASYTRYADLRTSAPITFAAVRRIGPTVASTARPVASVIASRLQDLDEAINMQSTEQLRSLLTLNFVQLGKDGRVELDFDRYIENTITDAVANSVARKTTLQGVKSVDGEWVATVRVASKRYLADTKPQYVVTYEQQTWVAKGGEPKLRVIKLLRRKGR